MIRGQLLCITVSNMNYLCSLDSLQKVVLICEKVLQIDFI
jgi:hypothetical protein